MWDQALFRSYFGNDVSVLGVDLSDGPKIPNNTENFIDLQVKRHSLLNAKYHSKVTFLVNNCYREQEFITKPKRVTWKSYLWVSELKNVFVGQVDEKGVNSCAQRWCMRLQRGVRQILDETEEQWNSWLLGSANSAADADSCLPWSWTRASISSWIPLCHSVTSTWRE